MPFWQTDFLLDNQFDQTSIGLSFGISDEIITYMIAAGVVLGVILFFTAALFITRFIFRRKAHRHGGELEEKVFQLSLPRYKSKEDADRTPNQDQVREMISDAESFFSSIGGLKAERGFKQWLIGRKDHISLEIVAKNKAIFFYVAVPENLRQHVEQQLSSSYPDVSIDEVEDYNIFSPKGTILGAYMKFKRTFAFPIKTYRKLDNDPMDSLTNTLSQVEEGDGVAIQFVLRSAHGSWRKAGLELASNMQQGLSMKDALAGKKKGGKKSWMDLFKTKKDDTPQDTYRLSPLEEEAVKGIEEKASKAGMDLNIRILVSTPSPTGSQNIMSNIINSFSQYNIYQFGNAFEKVVPRSKDKLIKRFIYRSFEEKYKVVVNTEEMSSLFHLPLSTTDTPNIHWLVARNAAAPVNTPTKEQGTLRIGTNVYRGKKTDIYMKREDRRRHVYMIGKSGSGKSQTMANMIVQDIVNGEGVGVIDPHGDLVEQVLESIPQNRIDDVIVFNPSDMERPMGMNMLEVEDENMMDFSVQEMIAVFYKLFPPEMIGPQFEHQMRNIMLTLMSDPKNPGTIAQIPRMFSDEEYQKQWIAKVKDPVVRSFWDDEMAKTSDFHKSEMLGYLISKVGRFVENTMMRNIIGQPKSSFNFGDIMDQQKILLVNLSKGTTGEVNAKLLGLIIVSKLQMAAMGRAKLAEEDRKDFYLYMDEFQNFVTDSIATILSEARKYRLCLTMAHQYVNQLAESGGKTEVRDAVLGNVGTTLVSRIGPEDADLLEKLYLPTFSGYDLINSDKFTWYTKIIIDNSQASPFTMMGMRGPSGDRELADAIIQLSRLKYGRDRTLVEDQILGSSKVKKAVAPTSDTSLGPSL